MPHWHVNFKLKFCQWRNDGGSFGVNTAVTVTYSAIVEHEALAARAAGPAQPKLEHASEGGALLA